MAWIWFRGVERIKHQSHSVGHFLCGIPQTRGGSCGNARTSPADHPTRFRPLSALSAPIVSVLSEHQKGPKSAKEIHEMGIDEITQSLGEDCLKSQVAKNADVIKAEASNSKI